MNPARAADDPPRKPVAGFVARGPGRPVRSDRPGRRPVARPSRRPPPPAPPYSSRISLDLSSTSLSILLQYSSVNF